MKKILSVLLAMLLLAGCSVEEKALSCNVLEISKYGNLKLNLTPDQLSEENLTPGDLVNIEIGELTLQMPLGTSYSDVDSGEMILREDTEDNEVIIAINMGDFATSTGLWTKEKTEDDPGYLWNAVSQSTEEIVIRISLAEKEGYKEQYIIRNLARSSNREDYADLSDEDFANFRMVRAGKMSESVLYRSSSPIDPELGRNAYVDAAMKEAGILTVINIDNTAEEMVTFEGYDQTYYSTCTIFNEEMTYVYDSEEFANQLANCIRFMTENNQSCLIHCKEGKDRTGIFVALIEGFAGATYDEIADDYMKTFANYYGVEKGSETYNIILSTNLNTTMSQLFNVEDFAKCDIAAETNDYFKEIGLTDSDIKALQSYLGF